MASEDTIVELYTASLKKDDRMTARKRKFGEVTGCYYSPQFGDYVNIRKPIDELRKTNRKYYDNPFQLNDVVIDKNVKEEPVNWDLTENFYANWGSLNI